MEYSTGCESCQGGYERVGEPILQVRERYWNELAKTVWEEVECGPPMLSPLESRFLEVYLAEEELISPTWYFYGYPELMMTTFSEPDYWIAET